jgi:anti-sigma factor RsiW
MNCSESTTLVAAYADGELDGLRGHAIERHLRGCAECAARRDDVLALRARIRRDVQRFAAPQATRERVIAMVAETRAPAPPRLRDRWQWLVGGALAGCATTVLAWLVGTAVLDWRANEDLAVDAVATHVRATLADHVVAIASSDQHTVKPWLSARLDYSPPVRDLAADGYRLAGGRVDFLDKRPVAVLVYQYRLHMIDVFVRPQALRTAPFAHRTVRGFNVARADGAGMEWLAVSDVNADVLSALVARLAQADSPP